MQKFDEFLPKNLKSGQIIKQKHSIIHTMWTFNDVLSGYSSFQIAIEGICSIHKLCEATMQSFKKTAQ